MPERTRKTPIPIPAPTPTLNPSLPAEGPGPAALRWARLDALRGAALLWMTAFHAAFDLNHLGLIARQDFHRDPLWTWQRVCILSTFLLCAGAGQVAAAHGRVDWPHFWRRWAGVALCAVLVSAGSWLMFPTRWISFGVLHALAVMLVLARLLAQRSSAAWAVLALGAWALPHVWRDAFFDTRWTNWVGLVTQRPATEDYVPLLPWFGTLLAGMLAMRWLLGRHRAWLGAPLPRVLRPLATLGRWSLTWYMLHQPLLLGLMQGWIWLRG